MRAYEPSLGRWINGDPIGLGGGINLHQYAESNPLAYTDRSGLNPFAGVWTGAEIGASVGGIGGAIVGGIIGGVVAGIIASEIAKNIRGQRGETVIDLPGKPPFRGPPNSTIRGDRQTRRYGPDGYPDVDVDTGHDHNPKQGDPHSHDWRRRPGEDVNDSDRGFPRPWKPGDPPFPRNAPRCKP
jgi:uncharacterized protein RhaS with RHS repeats